MSTDNSTLQSISPTSGRGSKQRPRHIWRRVILIVLIVALVLLATGGLVVAVSRIPSTDLQPGCQSNAYGGGDRSIVYLVTVAIMAP